MLYNQSGCLCRFFNLIYVHCKLHSTILSKKTDCIFGKLGHLSEKMLNRSLPWFSWVSARTMVAKFRYIYGTGTSMLRGTHVVYQAEVARVIAVANWWPPMVQRRYGTRPVWEWRVDGSQPRGTGNTSQRWTESGIIRQKCHCFSLIAQKTWETGSA